MSIAVDLGPRTELFALPRSLPLACGGTLEHGLLAYERFGRRDAPVVVVQGGISAGRQVATRGQLTGWWDAIVAPGGPIDLRRVQVLGIDFLGGVGASSGPGNHPGPFPVVTSIDQAHATACLLDHLGIDALHAFVGASYGGMVGLALASKAPARVERLVVFGAPAESAALATGWRCVQRDIVDLGRRAGDEAAGLAIARALAMTTYRGVEELQRRFRGQVRPDAVEPRFGVGEYLRARGRHFAEAFDAQSFDVLSRAIDLHAIDPASITATTTVLGARTDRLVPPSQLLALVAALEAPCVYESIDSVYGHDAFLVEPELLAPYIAAALAEGGRP